jgi:hypothetical protein
MCSAGTPIRRHRANASFAGDHVLVVAERDAVERAGVEVEHPGGFDGELWVADEDQDWCCKGLIVSRARIRRMVDAEIAAMGPCPLILDT